MPEMTPGYLHQQLEIDLAEIRAKKAAYDDVTFYAKTVQVFREYFLRMLPAWQADRERLEEAEWREKLQAKVMESQENLLVAYRVGMTGERVGRIIDKLQDAKAKLAALAGKEQKP